MNDITEIEEKMLVELDKRMDSGEQPYVLNEGGRWAFPAEALAEFNIQSGDSVSGEIINDLLQRQIDFCKEQIALGNATKH